MRSRSFVVGQVTTITSSLIGKHDRNDNPFAFIGRAAFSNTAGELRYRFEASTGDTIVEMDLNGDGLRDMSIRLTGTHDLVAGDFLL